MLERRLLVPRRQRYPYNFIITKVTSSDSRDLTRLYQLLQTKSSIDSKSTQKADKALTMLNLDNYILSQVFFPALPQTVDSTITITIQTPLE